VGPDRLITAGRLGEQAGWELAVDGDIRKNRVKWVKEGIDEAAAPGEACTFVHDAPGLQNRRRIPPHPQQIESIENLQGPFGLQIADYLMIL